MTLNYKLNAGEIGELRIMDVTGRLIVKYTLNNNENLLHINQTTLDNGMYLYQVLTDGRIINADKLILVK